jgi:F0F1-type ATP synthase assembly protein I
VFRKTREKSPYYLAAMDFGYTLLAAVGVFGWLGWWLDNRYGSTPWFLLGGIGLGLAVGFNNLFKKLNILEYRRKATKKPRSSKKPDSQP